MKITHLIFSCAALAILPAMAHAADESNGFGAPFANIEHPGFSNPDPDGEMINGQNLQDIEPAGGDDLDIANDNDVTEIEALHDDMQHSDIVIEDTIIIKND